MPIKRRRAIAVSSAALFSRPVRADSPVLNVLAHRVLRTVCGGPAGDVTAEWSKHASTRIEWLTFDQGPLQERLQRELALPETTIDLAFVLNAWATPQTAQFFEPLGPLLQEAPIDDFAEIFPNLVEPMRFGAALKGIPFRHSTDGLHYNEALLAERGIKDPPRTIEALVDAVRALTYRRPGGGAVSGFAIPGAYYGNVVDIARAWNGDFITLDRRYVGAERPMVDSVALLRSLYLGGNLPRNFIAMNSEDVNPLMQTGRVAISMGGIDRNRIYNDPEKSSFPGRIHSTSLPVAQALRSTMDVAPAKTEFWSIVIPRNSRNKRLAWELARALLSREGTLVAALNGNGPVRASTYEDPRFVAAVPYAAEARRILQTARVPLPAFDQANQAADMFKEQVEAAVLGMKSPQQAMDDLGRLVQPLLA